MLQKNKNKNKSREYSCFGDDNIFNKTQYQYSASGTGVNNSIRMRFDLNFKGFFIRYGFITKCARYCRNGMHTIN